MNAKGFIMVSFALVISIFANIALGFNVSSKSQEMEEYSLHIKELKQQNKGLKKSLKDSEEIISDEQMVEDREAKKVVEDFFKTQYEYNSDTYKKRFEKIKRFVNNDVYGQLTAAGIPEVPNIKFENRITNMKLYLTAQNKELSGLVLLDTVYKIEGVTNPTTTQIFQVTVSKRGGKQQIISLKVLGTFASMSES
ncbi:hypothetical protein B4102_2195 [Heyndrickxia sporothermodurans]|uniref:Uncharacterized protein n=1 Tax=Heyndrickxia sporothermodurans TaxID=46224 RepID=A0A150LGM0_9BACI|nr:hypothetical protein [Heyndrickxia sporothermodurans]KYD11467.1 hypothetical protein B4102_2195 [Heyndrickxia sporothermodurans]